jgi:hypothetical protein
VRTVTGEVAPFSARLSPRVKINCIRTRAACMSIRAADRRFTFTVALVRRSVLRRAADHHEPKLGVVFFEGPTFSAFFFFFVRKKEEKKNYANFSANFVSRKHACSPKFGNLSVKISSRNAAERLAHWSRQRPNDLRIFVSRRTQFRPIAASVAA